MTFPYYRKFDSNAPTTINKEPNIYTPFLVYQRSSSTDYRRPPFSSFHQDTAPLITTTMEKGGPALIVLDPFATWHRASQLQRNCIVSKQGERNWTKGHRSSHFWWHTDFCFLKGFSSSFKFPTPLTWTCLSGCLSSSVPSSVVTSHSLLKWPWPNH